MRNRHDTPPSTVTERIRWQWIVHIMRKTQNPYHEQLWRRLHGVKEARPTQRDMDTHGGENGKHRPDVRTARKIAKDWQKCKSLAISNLMWLGHRWDKIDIWWCQFLIKIKSHSCSKWITHHHMCHDQLGISAVPYQQRFEVLNHLFVPNCH